MSKYLDSKVFSSKSAKLRVKGARSQTIAGRLRGSGEAAAARKPCLSATVVILLLWGLTACASVMTPPPTGAGAMPGQVTPLPNPPVLEDSFAVSTMAKGAVWNVFVKGSDPDGDMSHLWVIVTQLGKRSESETIPLVGPDQRAFSGYFTIYPRGALFSPWEDLRVEVRIRDRAGHLSTTREQQVRMGFSSREVLPAQWSDATRHKLGTILFDLITDDGDIDFGIRGR